MQLTDEPDKRCYPLQDHLFCRSCHIQSLIKMGCHPSNEIEVACVTKPNYFSFHPKKYNLILISFYIAHFFDFSSNFSGWQK